MKGFGIEIKNNLLDPKHIEHMGIAVWLYMWCIDKMTSIDEDGVGKVLGGKPIKYEELGEELGISVRTYRRWVSILTKEGYINTKATMRGLIFTVNKAHKRFGKSYAKNGTPSSAESGTDGVPETAQHADKSGTPNKTIQLDNTVRQEPPHAAEVTRDSPIEQQIAEIIFRFRDYNPAYRNLFNRKPQREAARRMLEQFRFDPLCAMVNYLRHSNASRYAPTITTPIEMESNLGRLKVWADKQRDSRSGKGKKIIRATA